MADITAITTAFTGIKTAVEIAKLLKDADINLEKAELRLKIAELENALADANIAISEIQSVVQEKESHIDELKKAIKTKGDLVRRREAYYDKNNEGNPIGDPYCSRCLELEGIAIHLASHPQKGIECFCPQCKTTYWRALCQRIEA